MRIPENIIEEIRSTANAVADAIGERIFELPITPEKVLNAIKENGK